MNARFVALAALRYFRSRRRGSGGTATVLAVLGVAVGVMTLTAVLGVMNGFQLGFIESILEVSSYHLQLEPAGGQALPAATLERLRGVRGVRAVVPFTEEQALVEGRFTSPRGCLLRGLPPAVAEVDAGFAAHVRLVEGEWDLSGPASIVLGVELARYLGVGTGDAITVLGLDGGSFQELAASRRTYLVRGLFKSGYYEYDLGWAFVGLDPAQALSYGIKIRNRFRDQEALEAVRGELPGSGHRLGSWRDFNRAFFSALRVEKLAMMLLLGLIFVVVGFNIYHSLRRAVHERFEEIGVLKALGASDASLRSVFLAQGLLIGLLGGALGLALGLLAAANINGIFRAVEAVVNLAAAATERFALFSPTYFYLSEIPSRVLLPEAFLVVLFALGSCSLAAAFAAAAVREVKPMEVLHHE
jgi:lipoprotein-releasing system permease protein